MLCSFVIQPFLDGLKDGLVWLVAVVEERKEIPRYTSVYFYCNLLGPHPHPRFRKDTADCPFCEESQEVPLIFTHLSEKHAFDVADLKGIADPYE